MGEISFRLVMLWGLPGVLVLVDQFESLFAHLVAPFACPLPHAPLTFYCLQVGNGGLASISRGSPGLAHIHLKGCTQITDDGMSSIAALKELETVDLRACTSVTARGVVALQQLQRLRQVYLHGADVTGRDMELSRTPKTFQSCLDVDAKHYSLWWRTDKARAEEGEEDGELYFYDSSEYDSSDDEELYDYLANGDDDHQEWD